MEGINALNLESGVAVARTDTPAVVQDAAGNKFGPISAEKDSRSVMDLLFNLDEGDIGSQNWADGPDAPVLAASFGEPSVSNYDACQQLFELRRQLQAKRPNRGGNPQMMQQQQGVQMYPNGMMPAMGMGQMPMQNPQMGNMPPQMVGGPMNMNGMQVAPVAGMAPMQGGMQGQMAPDMSQPQGAPMMNQNMPMAPQMNQNMNQMGQPMGMQGAPAGQGPQGPMGPGGPQGQMGPGGGPGQMPPNQMQGGQMPMQGGGQMPMNMGYPMNYGNMPYGMQNGGMPMDQQGYMMNQGMMYGGMPNQMQGNWQQGPMGQPSGQMNWQNASPPP
jgi:hypothetical protein